MAVNPALGGRFWRLWAASSVSSLGDGLSMVGLPLLALSFTRSPTLIGGVAAVARLPGLAVALPAGALIDRVQKRRFLVRLQVVRLASVGAFAALVATKVDDLAIVYLAAFLLGCLTVVFDCSVAASLPALVEPASLVAANARLETAYRTAQDIVGRALGGVAFAAQAALPFLANAVGYLASLTTLPAALPDTEPVASTTSFRADLRAGLRWFGQSSLMRLVSGTVALLAFCQAVVFGLLVLFATEDLHLSQSGFGLLLGITAGGGLLGGAVANRAHVRWGAGWSLVLAGLVSGLTYIVQSTTHSVVVAGLVLTLEAAAVVVGVVASQSLRQAIVPADMQGRVASAHMTLVLAAFPLGSLVGGALASAVGIRTTFLIAGCAQFVLVAVSSPRLVARTRKRQTFGISNL